MVMAERHNVDNDQVGATRDDPPAAVGDTGAVPDATDSA
jgi:hypothetical protein